MPSGGCFSARDALIPAVNNIEPLRLNAKNSWLGTRMRFRFFSGFRDQLRLSTLGVCTIASIYLSHVEFSVLPILTNGDVDSPEFRGIFLFAMRLCYSNVNFSQTSI